MHEITLVHWLWVIGMGFLTLILLFLAAESIIKGKMQIPAFVLAGFLIVLASFTMSLFLSCVHDFQNEKLDTFRAIHREWQHIAGFFRLGYIFCKRPLVRGAFHHCRIKRSLPGLDYAAWCHAQFTSS